MPKLRQNLPHALLLSIVVLLLWSFREGHLRAREGVDFTDESFYVALPYRFALGDQPFRDEIAVHQTAALLAYPAVKAYVMLKDGPDGLVLFTRRLFLILAWSVAGVVFLCSKKDLGYGPAGMIGLACVTFAGIPIANVSYNTLGMAGLCLTLFLTFGSRPHPTWHRGVAIGVCLGLTSTAYPTLIVAAPFLVGYLTWHHQRQRRLPVVLAIASGVALGLAPLALTTIWIGPEHLADAIALTNKSAPKLGGSDKLLNIMAFLGSCVAIWPTALLLLSAVVARKFSSAGRVIPLVECLAVVSTFLQIRVNGEIRPILDWAPVLVSIGLLAPALAVGKWQAPLTKSLMLGVWLPSLVCGITTAFTSSEGTFNFPIGGFPMTLASLALILAPASGETKPTQARLAVVTRAFLLVLVGLGIVLATRARREYVYRDERPAGLTQELKSGPFAGICTNQPKAKLLTDLEEVLEAKVPKEARIIFYNDFPAGFLLSKRRPAICGVWVYTLDQETAFRSMYVECSKRMVVEPTFVVQMLGDPKMTNLQPIPPVPGDPFNELIEKCRGEDVAKTENYRVSRLDANCVGAARQI